MLCALLTLALLAPPQANPADSKGHASPDEYRIGVGDILKVTVYGNDDLSQVVVVQQDGSFNFPLIGRLAAADLTVRELGTKLTETLGRSYIRNPQVTVVVQEFRSRRVFVVGEVSRPGTYPLSGQTTLVEILSKAGPLSMNAGSQITIVRPGNNAEGPLVPAGVAEQSTAVGIAPPTAEVLLVNLRELEAGDLSRNVLLQANDTVFVPAARRVYVSGEVRNPGGVPYSIGMTIRQAITLAGGLTEDGSTRKIYAIRDVKGQSKQVRVKLEELIKPGDTIVVKAKLF